jgi:hypothetical protein
VNLATIAINKIDSMGPRNEVDIRRSSGSCAPVPLTEVCKSSLPHLGDERKARFATRAASAGTIVGAMENEPMNAPRAHRPMRHLTADERRRRFQI